MVNGQTLDKETALRLGYVSITIPYKRKEEALFMQAKDSMRGARWCVVGREIWRHGSEVDDCTTSALRNFRSEKLA